MNEEPESDTAVATLDAPPPVEPTDDVANATDEPEDDPEPTRESVETVVVPSDPASNKKWYVIKVTSGREETIKAAIERKVKIEALEEFFAQIVIPVERVTTVKKVKETDRKSVV